MDKRSVILASYVVYFSVLCAAIIADGSDSDVVGDFGFTAEPADMVVTKDRSVTLDCSVQSSVGMVNFQWIKDDIPMTINNRRHIFSNGSLRLESRLDEGTYQCIATVAGLGSIVSRKAKLVLAYLDKTFDIEPEGMSVHLGDMVMLPCQIQGAPKPIVLWYKDDNEIDLTNSNYLLHSEDGVLEIRSMQFPDFGRYKCKASSGDRSKSSAEAKIDQDTDVSTYQGVPPRFMMRPREQVIVEGTTVVLYCGSNGRDRNSKRPKTSWLKDGATIDLQQDGRFSLVGESSLRIDGVSEDDTAMYTCRSTNQEDSIDSDINLSIQVPPKLRLRPKNVVAVVGTDTELLCDIYAIPRPVVQWFKNGAAVVQDDYVQMVDDYYLRILGVQLSDEGMYQCIGTNEVGSIHAIARLVVKPQDVSSMATSVGAPSVPLDLTAPITSMRFATLSWRQPYTFGMSEVLGYIVSWKEDGSTRERELNTTVGEANVQHLKPSTKYTFQVRAYNSQGFSETDSVSIETQAEVQVPDPPSNLQATVLSPTTVQLTWDGPKVNSSTSPVTGYKLFFYDTGDASGIAETEATVATTTYTLNNLKKFHQYSFRVVAYNSNGQGTSTDEVICRTFSDAPSAAPQNVSLETQSATSILVRWEAPPEDSQNGIITGYKIRYRVAKDKTNLNVVTVDGTQILHSLLDLAKGTEYSIQVQAQTRNGTGPLSAIFKAQTYTHDLDESKVPNHPSSLRVRPLTNSIVVSWTPPIEQDVMIRGYVVGYGIGIPDVFRQILDAKQRYHTIKGLQPSSEYVISLKAFNGAGEGMPVYETTITREETPTEPSTPIIPPVGLKAIVLSSTTIVLTWTDTTLGRNQRVMDNRHYTIKYTPRAQRKQKFINSTDLNVHIEDLKPDTEYEFSVKIVKGKRQSSYSLSIFNKTKEASPATAPRDVTPVAVENKPNWISLSWQPPRQTNGQITGYLVFYTTDSSLKDIDWVLEAVLGDRLSTTIKDLSLETTYYFKIQARNIIGYSPMSPTVIYRTPRYDGHGGGLVEMPDDYGRHPKPHIFRDRGEYPDSRTAAVTEIPFISSVNIPMTILWIIIACVGGFTVVAVVIVTAVICLRKRRTPKSVLEQRKGYMPANKEKCGSKDLKPPDLWIHGRMEMKNIEKSEDADEGMAMMSNREHQLQLRDDYEPDDQSDPGRYHGDMDRCHDPDRFRRLGNRPQPVMIPVDQPPPSREPFVNLISNGHVGPTPPSAIVRPVYPRTQYTSQYAGAPRVNAGHISHPVIDENTGSSLERIKQLEPIILQSGSTPGHPPIQNSNFTKAPTSLSPTTNMSKSPMSKVGATSPTDGAPDSKSFTTEELSEEMANLEGLMKDLNAITQHEFEC